MYISDSVIPADLLEDLPIENSKWESDLISSYKNLIGLSKEETINKYLLKCTKLPFYGFHLFPVQFLDQTEGIILPDEYYIGLHHSGVFFLGANKKIYGKYSYWDVLTHTSTPHIVTLTFSNNITVSARTIKGDEIISLVIDYKYLMLKPKD